MREVAIVVGFRISPILNYHSDPLWFFDGAPDCRPTPVMIGRWVQNMPQEEFADWVSLFVWQADNCKDEAFIESVRLKRWLRRRAFYNRGKCGRLP